MKYFTLIYDIVMLWNVKGDEKMEDIIKKLYYGEINEIENEDIYRAVKNAWNPVFNKFIKIFYKKTNFFSKTPWNLVEYIL